MNQNKLALCLVGAAHCRHLSSVIYVYDDNEKKNLVKQNEEERRLAPSFPSVLLFVSPSRYFRTYEPSETKNTRVAINLVMSCRRYELQSDAVDKRMMNYSRGPIWARDLVWSLLTRCQTATEQNCRY